MQSADALFRAGDLDGARSVLVENVRAAPADAKARMFLFQLLCLGGEWQKAKTQLQALAKLSPEAQMLSVAYGQAIDAEQVRADVFAGTVRAKQLVTSEWAEGLIDALQHFGSGDVQAGIDARERAFEAAPDTPGTLDGARFDWIADADGRFGPAIEAIVMGQYGFIPFDVIERIESEGPRDLRDTVWYPVQIAFKKGQSVAALLPARYPGSEAAEESAERFGRATGWSDRPWGQVGSGQHLWALSSGEDHGLLSLRTLVFD
jgi:type VI secretion system protein ImpE